MEVRVPADSPLVVAELRRCVQSPVGCHAAFYATAYLGSSRGLWSLLHMALSPQCAHGQDLANMSAQVILRISFFLVRTQHR